MSVAISIDCPPLQEVLQQYLKDCFYKGFSEKGAKIFTPGTHRGRPGRVFQPADRSKGTGMGPALGTGGGSKGSGPGAAARCGELIFRAGSC